MDGRDLNLLRALDALLDEGSVVDAARRLGLSASAMSRTLARLRDATGDPLLVRAGRGMVLTPHAEALRERVPHLAAEVEAVLRPAETTLDPESLQRDFVIRANDGFIAAYGATLLRLVRERAPAVRILFVQKDASPARALRDGLCDLELGILRDTAPELKVQRLLTDHFVGVVRAGHPLAGQDITARDFAESDSIVSILHQPADFTHVVDRALAGIGLKRRRTFQVPSFLVALSMAQQSDLVAVVPQSYARMERRRMAALGLPGPEIFELPFDTGEIVISLIWHPRMDSDPANRWLRELVRECTRLVGQDEIAA
ncbi:transcriptional regulator, LysR family [Citreicella sp. SE45]|uniref:Transcriptional regulator, LysR family n=1 Tax=Salipiger thiooxidans TaxID=282683 RepID=A0A1G7FQN5_9RHOB|nr:LysR family transcriptional regulator [Salipiger thiooxidans]EEX11855.1 transcriptional regulator, LysR family [Citreicella sp. SE45]MAU46058.1 LysR family transcriptional regulator [Salipiger sp.]SDE78223.1 transcriptional regulator, LysR family [Salipiger thiooxidans]